MEITVLVLVHIGIGFLLIRRNVGMPKPIHIVAITFFIMIAVYAAFSLLPIIGQFVHVVKKYINLDVIQF
jgi:hypothetical protein